MGSELIEKCREVGQQVMNLLMKQGAPYHEGITNLVMDLEFHYQVPPGEILSSVEMANLYIQTDVRFHSEAMGLSYELGKQIFHFWADTVHQDDYRQIIAEGEKLEGSLMGIEKICQAVQTILEQEDPADRNFH